MKRYFTILLLFLICSKIVAQITNDTSNVYEALYSPKLENFNFSDTIKNSFAKYLIKSNFSSYIIRQKELKESSLNDQNGNRKNLFRILSLPTFNHPICFTIVSVNEKYYVYWTMGKGSGGYEPKGIKKKGKTKISKNDWQYFLSLIDAKSIDTLPLCSYMPMCDGTSWVIDKNINGKQKIHFTNYPNSQVEDAFALLSHISKVKNKETINLDSHEALRFFNRNNTKINLDSISHKILNHLNKNLNKELSEYAYFFECGIYIKLNSRGRIKSVKYAPEFIPHRSFEDKIEYYEANFQDRKPRRIIKTCLNSLKLQGIVPSRNIWIPIFIKYNKDNNMLELDKEN